MRYQVVFESEASADLDGRKADADRLEAFLDRTMVELLKLGAEDAAVGATLARGSFEVSITVEAVTPQQAIEVGNRVIRTATQSAGGLTPEWPPNWIAARASRVGESAEASA